MEENIRKVVEAARESLEAAERLGIREPEPLNQLVQKMGRITGMYPIPHLAVEVCCGYYISTIQELREKKHNEDAVSRAGQIAYCSVLPRLSDSETIRDFIACVVHGMAIGAIPSSEGTRLLYGAQVAHSALPSPKRHKNASKALKKRLVTNPQHPPHQ